MTGEIYGLYDPRSGALRYIGQTVHGARRRSYGHMCDAKRKPHTHVARWLLDLGHAGLRPVVKVLATCDAIETIGAMEQRWIADARARGENLTNITDGGDGGALGLKHSPATIAKMRARPNAWSGRKHTAESRRLMSQTQKRVWANRPDLKLQQSQRHKGKTVPQYHRDAVGAAARRNWSDDNYRVRVLATRKRSERCRAGHTKQASALRGRARDKAAVATTAFKCRKVIVDQHGTKYPSFDAAAKALGVSPSNISAVVNGHRSHTQGFTFRLYTGPMEIAS